MAEPTVFALGVPREDICTCPQPSPRFYDDREPGHLDHWIYLCTACGQEIINLGPPPYKGD
jgi:hypothetical protein